MQRKIVIILLKYFVCLQIVKEQLFIMNVV